jgi:hypothetical protein
MISVPFMKRRIQTQSRLGRSNVDSYRGCDLGNLFEIDCDGDGTGRKYNGISISLQFCDRPTPECLGKFGIMATARPSGFS